MKPPSFIQKYHYSVIGISIFALLCLCFSTHHLIHGKGFDSPTIERIMLVDSRNGVVQDFRTKNINLSRNKVTKHPQSLETRIKSNFPKDQFSLKPSPLILIILSVIFQIIGYWIYSVRVPRYYRSNRNFRMKILLRG